MKTYKSPKRRPEGQETAIRIPVTIHDTTSREHQTRGRHTKIVFVFSLHNFEPQLTFQQQFLHILLHLLSLTRQLHVVGSSGQIIRESIREDIYVTRSTRSSPVPPLARSPPPQGQVNTVIQPIDMPNKLCTMLKYVCIAAILTNKSPQGKLF